MNQKVKKSQKKELKKQDITGVANLLYEVGILSRTPRSGLHFLGTGNQSVAEHLYRTCMIGYSLSQLEPKADVSKVLQMCLLHDISEARISDLNYVHQKYVVRKENEAVKDLSDTVVFGDKILETISEYEKRESIESILAKDADNLEWIITLKEQVDTGNTRALDWIKSAVQRLKTDLGQSIAREIMNTESTDWWFGDKESKWWVNRGKE